MFIPPFMHSSIAYFIPSRNSKSCRMISCYLHTLIVYPQERRMAFLNMKGDLPMKQKKDTENQRIIDSYDYLGKAASSMDCTGLIPSAPTCRAELESYEALYSYQPPHLPYSDSEKNKKEAD